MCIRLSQKSSPKPAPLVENSLTALVHSGEEGGSSLCWQAAPVSAWHTCKRIFAPASHRRAAPSLLDWSEVADGAGAKQRGRWRQPRLASSPRECQQERQIVSMHLAPKSSHKPASAGQSKQSAAASVKCSYWSAQRWTSSLGEKYGGKNSILDCLSQLRTVSQLRAIF